MTNPHTVNVSALPASTPTQIEGSYLGSVCWDVTSILQVLKVACVGTSQSMHSLEMNKASLETSFTRKQRILCHHFHRED